MAENIIAELKAVLRLGVETKEAEKANTAVKKFQEHMERAKAALKEGTFDGAIKDVEKINARFENAREKVSELNKTHQHGQALLRAQGAEQERVNSLASAYLNILKQVVSVRGSGVGDTSTGKSLLTPASRFDPGATASILPKEADFQIAVKKIEDEYRSFLERINSARLKSEDVNQETISENLQKQLALEEAAMNRSKEMLMSSSRETMSVTKETFDNVESIIREYSDRAASYSKTAMRAAEESGQQIAESAERVLELQNKLTEELIHQSKARLEYERQFTATGQQKNEAKIALDTQKAIVRGLESQIREEQFLQRAMAETSAAMRARAEIAKSEVLEESFKQFEALKGSVGKYELEVNALSQSLQKATGEQRKLLEELANAQKLLEQSRSTAGMRRKAQEANELSVAFRNLQAAAVVAMGPLSGLGARLASIGGVVARSGSLMAGFVTALGGVIAGVQNVVTAAIQMRREFEAQIALLDLTRTATERVGESFQFVIQIADQYGLAIQGLINPITRLKVAAQGTGIAQIFPDFIRDIAAIAGAFQLPTDSIHRMTKALEQMLSKGLVQAEELRQQLGDVLPGSAHVALLAFREMTEQPFASMRNFMDAMKDGEVESEKFLSIFLKKYHELIGIDPSKVVDTLNASYARLNTTYVQFILAMDDSFGITRGVSSVINELASMLRFATAHMETLVLAARTFITVALGLVGIRLIAHFVQLHAAIMATSAGMSTLSITALSFRNIMGVFVGSIAIVGALVVAFNTLFGGIGDEAAKSSRALEEFGTSLERVKQSTSSGNLFVFQTSMSDTGQFTKDLENYIKVAKDKLSEGIVLEPSIDLDASLAGMIASLRNRSADLTDEITSMVNQASRVSIDQLRQIAQESGGNAEAMKKASDALGLIKQAGDLEVLRGEYIKLAVAQESVSRSAQETGLIFRILDSAIGFLADTANFFATAGAAIVLTLVAVRHGLLGASAAAATTTGAFTALARRLNIIGAAAAAAGLALTLFSKEATAADISDSLAPPMERLREYIGLVKETGDLDLSTLRQAQELARQEIERVSTSLRTAQDEMVKYEKTMKETSEGSGFTGLARRIAPAFQLHTLPDKIEALREGLIDLKQLQAELDTIAAQVEQRMGSGYAGLLTDNDETTRVVNDLREKMERLRVDIEVFNGTRTQAAIVARNYADEEREVAKALSGTKLSTGEAKAILEEYMALWRQREQLESSTKLQEVLTSTEQRAVAARDGLMKQFDAQQRVNEAVEQARVLAIESGLSQEEINQKLDAYRANLLAIDEAQKRASESSKSWRDKLKETHEVVRTISGPFKRFVDSIAGLASTGKLSFKSFVGTMRDLIQGLIKDILTLILKINILDPLLKGLNAGAQGGTGIGGFLASLLGGATPFATGGIIDGPTFFGHRGGLGIAGEAGAEAILPLSRGAGGKLGVRADGGNRPISVTFNISTPNPEAFRRSESQMSAVAARVIGRGNRNL